MTHTSTLVAGRPERDELGCDAGTPQYLGAAPPANSGVHAYRIRPLSTSDTCGVDAGASAAWLGFTIAPHTVGRAVIVCPTTAPT